MEDEIMMEKTEQETAIETYDDGETSIIDGASSLPAIGVGVVIGATALYAIPRAFRSGKKLFMKAKAKIVNKMAASMAADQGLEFIEVEAKDVEKN